MPHLDAAKFRGNIPDAHVMVLQSRRGSCTQAGGLGAALPPSLTDDLLGPHTCVAVHPPASQGPPLLRVLRGMRPLPRQVAQAVFPL